MLHEYTDDLCLHCGLPPRHAPVGEVCPVNRYGAPARVALESIGLVYVGFETRDMYANYRDTLAPGFCGRMFWPQIVKILELASQQK